MLNNELKYYEQNVLWSNNYLNLPGERIRIKNAIDLIPHDVKSILDVGCGNGVLINNIPDHIYKVGVDFSKSALRHVVTDKIQGGAENIPVKSDSFDLVTCMEVLEHLSFEGYKKAINEIQRISKKYILITVPNNENLKKSLVVCRNCFCHFNPNRHTRNFNEISLNSLFIAYSMISCNEIGPIVEYRNYPDRILSIYSGWKKPVPPNTALCPQCGYQLNENNSIRNVNPYHTKQKYTFKKYFVNLLFPVRFKSRWLIALYERKSNETKI